MKWGDIMDNIYKANECMILPKPKASNIIGNAITSLALNNERIPISIVEEYNNALIVEKKGSK